MVHKGQKVISHVLPQTSNRPLSLFCYLPRPGEEKLNILEIVKPVETVEVVIDPDAAGEEGTLVEDGQLIAVERTGLSDETSEQVTRWAAALEGYRKEQVRLGIQYGEEDLLMKCNPNKCICVRFNVQNCTLNILHTVNVGTAKLQKKVHMKLSSPSLCRIIKTVLVLE